jgi:kumamolisin
MANDKKLFVTLKGSERAHRSGSEVVRRSDRDEECDVTVKVRRKAALPEPTAKPLSRADVLSRYAADPKDLDEVQKVLTPFGLTLKSKSPETHALEFVGPVSAMEQAFGVTLMVVKHGDRVYRGRVGPLHIPKELDGIVTGVFGLDTRPMVKHRRAHAHRSSTIAAATTGLPPANSRPWFTPQELAQAYSFPPGDGSGQSIGILEFGGEFRPKDLATFLRLVGMAGVEPNVQVRAIQALPSKEQKDPDAIGEVMLDIEVVSAVCPKATIVVLFSQFTEKGWIANLDAVLTDPAAPSVVSVSYGLAEGTDIWTQAAINEVNDSLKAVAVAGVTVCMSAGDDGSDDQVADGAAHLDFPASSPYVLSVGGTALQKMSGEEVVWFDGDGLRRDGGGSTGGGVSALNARPEWQSKIDIVSVNRNSQNGRVVPDVTANAAGSTGYLVVAPNPQQPSKSAPQVSGGTSASTPLWASLIARIQQSGKQVGFLPPKLYAATPKSGGHVLGQAAFRDITSGSNASGTADGYSAGPGFDAVSGWGSPIGTKLLELL